MINHERCYMDTMRQVVLMACLFTKAFMQGSGMPNFVAKSENPRKASQPARTSKSEGLEAEDPIPFFYLDALKPGVALLTSEQKKEELAVYDKFKKDAFAQQAFFKKMPDDMETVQFMQQFNDQYKKFHGSPIIDTLLQDLYARAVYHPKGRANIACSLHRLFSLQNAFEKRHIDYTTFKAQVALEACACQRLLKN